MTRRLFSVNPAKRRATLEEYTPAPCPVCGADGQKWCRDEEGNAQQQPHAAREWRPSVDADHPKGERVT